MVVTTTTAQCLVPALRHSSPPLASSPLAVFCEAPERSLTRLLAGTSRASRVAISLSRMVIDIMKFTFLYLLVLFAFSCGMNQLLWYYADLEQQACMDDLKAHSNNQTTMHAISGRKSNKVVVVVAGSWLT